MRLPVVLPDSLRERLEKAKDASDLYDLLIENPYDLLLFCENALEDETWCLANADCVQRMIALVQRQFFEGRIGSHDGILRALQRHFYALHMFIPKDVAFLVEGKRYLVSSMLWGMQSEPFLLRFREGLGDVELPWDTFSFLSVKEFIETSEIRDLDKRDPKELIFLLEIASDWEIEGLAEAAEPILSRYLTVETMVEYCLFAYKKGFSRLFRDAVEYIRAQNLGFFLHDAPVLKGEFLHFRDPAMNVFEGFRSDITHFVAKGFQKELFLKVLPRCPRLIGLDFSDADEFSDLFFLVPRDLQELDFSRMEALDDLNLSSVVSHCKGLSHLGLENCLNLTYLGFSSLEGVPLTSLDISHCRQCDDDLFDLILHVCPGLKRLLASDLPEVSDRGFFSIAKNVPHLRFLDVSKTSINDMALAEIAVRCTHLEEIDLRFCDRVTRIPPFLQGVFVKTHHLNL